MTQGSDTAARHAAQKEFPNPIEGAPLPHLTLSDLPIAALRKVGGAMLSSTVNARNARIGADAANALSATDAEHQRLLQAIRDTIGGKALGQARAEQARRAATLGVESEARP